jgi:hypothetical protein
MKIPGFDAKTSPYNTSGSFLVHRGHSRDRLALANPVIPAQTVARSNGSGGLPELRECSVEVVCEEYIDANGFVRRWCVPILRCEPIIWV